MAALSKLASAPDSKSLPGRVLSRLDLADYGECEREFELDSLARAAAVACHLPAAVAEHLLAKTQKEVDDGLFGWGTLRFDSSMLKVQYIPLLLYLSLKHRHPEVTRAEAEQLWRQHGQKPALHDVLLDLAGYPRSTGDKKGLNLEPTGQSTSESSSGSSESGASTAPRSDTTSSVA